MGTPVVVALLVADVVSSTELFSSMPPDDADLLRRDYLGILQKVIGETDGRLVTNLGDGVLAAYPSASRALECGAQMQQQMDRRNQHAAVPVSIRVGVSMGEAVEEDGDYFGQPVVESARLCARAAADQILTTAMVRSMAGRNTTRDLVALGEVQLEGLPDPTEIYEVGWQRSPGDRGEGGNIPLPQRLAQRPWTGLIGRSAEVGELESALKQAADEERCSVVLIGGEAGQGKTTLVSHFASTAHDSGAVVLLGRCDQEVGRPYQPFADALEHLVAHADLGVLEAHVEVHGGELASLVPDLVRRLGELPPSKAGDPDTERYLLYQAVIGLVRAVSTSQPMILILDDLQWADSASLELFRHLVKFGERMSILVLATFRDTEITSTHPVFGTLAAMRREGAVHRIDLRGLGDTDVVDLLEAAAGHQLDEAGISLAHAVYRETDGNPFFVTEVLRNLSESGAIVQNDSGRWVPGADLDEVALPYSVREVVESRVGRIGEQGASVLAVAAVIGRDFDVHLLAQIAETDLDDLLNLMDLAEGAALVREVPDAPGIYTFVHGLIQHTLYQSLGSTRRAMTHRRVAEAIETVLGDDVASRAGELAHHFLAATRPAEIDKAALYVRLAGQDALQALAPRDAVSYFEQALELLSSRWTEDPGLHVDLLLDLGTAQRQAGTPEFRETLLRAAKVARANGYNDRLVAAALANTRGWVSSIGEVDAERVTVLEQALATMTDDDGPAHALLLATLSAELQYSSTDRREMLAGRCGGHGHAAW